MHTQWVLATDWLQGPMRASTAWHLTCAAGGASVSLEGPQPAAQLPFIHLPFCCGSCHSGRSGPCPVCPGAWRRAGRGVVLPGPAVVVVVVVAAEPSGDGRSGAEGLDRGGVGHGGRCGAGLRVYLAVTAAVAVRVAAAAVAAAIAAAVAAGSLGVLLCGAACAGRRLGGAAAERSGHGWLRWGCSRWGSCHPACEAIAACLVLAIQLLCVLVGGWQADKHRLLRPA